MPRPTKCRRVCHYPRTVAFCPADASENQSPILLTIDEYETIRLIDGEGLSQEQCSASMQIARTTVQKIYENARRKLADMLVHGRALRIEGGDFQLCDGQGSRCGGCGCRRRFRQMQKEEKTMRIAIPVDENGRDLCVSFGRAPWMLFCNTETGVQEALADQLQYLDENCAEYARVGVGRDDGDKAGETMAIYYRRDRFELADSGTLWLSETPETPSRGWDGACTRIATWAKLEDKSTGKIFLAVNTHMDHVGVEARRKGALLIIERIQDIVGNRPAVLTGDFNVDDTSEAYQTLTTNDFVLKDAYKTADVKEGVSYTFHDFEKIPVEEREKIDFIFVTPQIKVSRSWIPKENPDGKGVISDHNPQLATLQF